MSFDMLDFVSANDFTYIDISVANDAPRSCMSCLYLYNSMSICLCNCFAISSASWVACVNLALPSSNDLLDCVTHESMFGIIDVSVFCMIFSRPSFALRILSAKFLNVWPVWSLEVIQSTHTNMLNTKHWPFVLCGMDMFSVLFSSHKHGRPPF